jgi:hypothetical protein
VTANIFDATALGDLSFVRGPVEVGFTFRTDIHYSKALPEENLLLIEDNLVLAAKDFVNSLDIGQSLFINRMVSEFFDVSDNIANFGDSGKSILEAFVHKPSRLEDNKVRGTLLGDYTTDDDERVIIEPSVVTPITFDRKFVRR